MCTLSRLSTRCESVYSIMFIVQYGTRQTDPQRTVGRGSAMCCIFSFGLRRWYVPLICYSFQFPCIFGVWPYASPVRDPSVLRMRSETPCPTRKSPGWITPTLPRPLLHSGSAVAIIEPSLLTMSCPLERGGRLALPASGSAHLAPCHLGTVCKG